MKKCGIHYFMTTKISWNEFNKMPYDTFEWEGIDGTRILTHFSPSRDYNKSAVEGGTETEHYTTYNAFINPLQVKGGWERYSQKHLNDEVLMSFGYGDGGGGPTRDMLENQRRIEKGIPGCPRTIMSTASEFFHKLEKEVKGNKYLPSWVGELYLEYHRGTYTSMARNKKYNRKSEFLFQNVEHFSVLDMVLGQAKYPKFELASAWEVILRNQFHDILPGSSIKEVYEDSKVEYEGIKEIGTMLVANALTHIVENVNAKKGSIVVFNPNSSLGDSVVYFDNQDIGESIVVSDNGNLYPVQKGQRNSNIFYAEGVPSKGYKVYEVQEGKLETTLKADERHLENDLICVCFDENGQMSSIFDKQMKREVLQENKKANVLMTYEDRPHNFDAWDINNYYVEKSWEIKNVVSIDLVERGPVRATICIKRNYLDSTIEQYISLLYNSTEIIIRNEIDWKEKNIFMKSLFPVDIHTDEATYEIQYGNVKRKTHYNTMWDYAKFEVCMHKWIDISEDGYGVSMINDCKYGCHVHDGEIGISMLKSAMYPNPDADKEHHSFTFSIYPHEGDWKAAGTIKKAYSMNNPMNVVVKKNEKGNLPKNYSFVNLNVDNVVIEVVKQAEDGDGIIIRLYETNNKRTKLTLNFGIEIKKMMECNMLEVDETIVQCSERSVSIQLKPYEIKTLKVIV